MLNLCRLRQTGLATYLTRNISSRLKTMKLESEKFQNVLTPELMTLSDLFIKHGYELRIAGGAVRDLLMDKAPADVDFATTATPDQMKDMFEKVKICLIFSRVFTTLPFRKK